MSCGLWVWSQALLQTLASPEWWLVEPVLVIPRIRHLDGFLLLCCNTLKTPKLHAGVLLISLFYIHNWCDWSKDVHPPLGKSCSTQLWRGEHGLLSGNSRWVPTGRLPIKFKAMLWISPGVLVPDEIPKLRVPKCLSSKQIGEQWQSERSKRNPLWCWALWVGNTVYPN